MKLYVIVSMYNCYGEKWLWHRAYCFRDKQKAEEFYREIQEQSEDTDYDLVETELID